MLSQIWEVIEEVPPSTAHFQAVGHWRTESHTSPPLQHSQHFTLIRCQYDIKPDYNGQLDDTATGWWMIWAWHCDWWHFTYWYCNPSSDQTMLNRFSSEGGTFMTVVAGSGCLQRSVVIWWIPSQEFWPFSWHISKSFSPSEHYKWGIVRLDPPFCLSPTTPIWSTPVS